MALARYSDVFWYPSGAPAASVPVRVFALSAPTLVDLWSDVTGTVALPNPLTTTTSGVLEFWAEEGEYWVRPGNESFRVSVGSPNVDVFEASSATTSTGIVSGGYMTVNGSNPSAVDISPLVGYVVDMSTDPVRPTATRVSTGQMTVALDAAALMRTPTWWMVDAAGVVHQIDHRPTNVELRQRVALGFTAQLGGSIYTVHSTAVLMHQPMNQFSDLVEGLATFSISGNLISPNGANLRLNQSGGRLFSRSVNYNSGAVLTNNPNVHTTIAQTPLNFQYFLRNTTTLPPQVNVVNPTVYDNAGVLTAVGGGANTSTVQRIWAFTTNTTTGQILVQYGQSTYSSLSAAVNAIGSGTHVPNPLFTVGGALVAYLAVVRSATDLSDPTQAVIVTAGKFPSP